MKSLKKIRRNRAKKRFSPGNGKEKTKKQIRRERREEKQNKNKK